MKELCSVIQGHFLGPKKGKDNAWGWATVFAGFVISMCTHGFGMTFSLVFPSILRDLKTSKAKAAFVGSIMVTTMALPAPIVSIIADRIGLRKTVCFGSLSLGVSLFLTSLCNSVETLYIAFGLLTGTSASFVVTPCAPVVGYYFNRKTKLALGYLSAGIPFASIVLSPLFAHMLQIYGWRALFRVLSIGMGLTLVFASFTFVPTVDELRHRREVRMAEKSKKLDKYKNLLRNPRSIVLLIAIAVNGLAANTFGTHIVELCLEYGIPWSKASTIPIVMGISSCTGRFLAGLFNTYSVVSSITTYQVALILVFGTCIIGSWAKSFLELAILTAIYMVLDGASIGMPALPVLEVSGPEHFQQLMALTAGLQSLFLVLPGPIVGWLVDRTSDYRYLMYWTSWPCLVTAVILTLLRFEGMKCMEKSINVKSLTDLSTTGQAFTEKNILIERETSV